MNLTEQTFNELITAASLAPSADNMQAWEFKKKGNSIQVFYARQRALPTDVNDMFGWIGVGAAIQNIEIVANNKDFKCHIEYLHDVNSDLAATLTFSKDSIKNELSEFIYLRNTNRSLFDNEILSDDDIFDLSKSIANFKSGIHWTTDISDFKKISYLDANSSYIRLEHKPLHDELFEILRFTKKDIEKFRYGLTFESLEVPRFAVFFAKQLQYWSFNNIVSKLGFGKMVAKQLSNKLQKAGALCLITAKQRNKAGYIEAGRALENLWLTATKMNLSIQPYGVLPQYLTKTKIEPDTFLQKYLDTINSHRKVFNEIFPDSVDEFPAIVLRIGKTEKKSARSDIRLNINQLIK